MRQIAPSHLGAPWVWFVVPCRSRLFDVQRTIDSVIAQPSSTYVLVDYTCPQASGAWVRARHPSARVVRVDGQPRFHGARARNLGAAAVDPDGILCFLDADVAPAPGFSGAILSAFSEEALLVPDAEGPAWDTTLVCSRAAFDRAGGFDETLLHWGEEVLDLRASLRSMGLVERRFPAALLTPGGHPHADRAGVDDVPSRQAARAIHAAFRRIKAAIHGEPGGGDVPLAVLREVFDRIASGHLSDAIRAMPCASVAFRERMGFSLARLEAGASTHNNDPRPLAGVPGDLAGRQFTQVVAGRTTPVEVEFLSEGKLYVLVGTDWEGCEPARAWLREAGQRERMPPLETARGTAFEVWSVLGASGDRFVIPTQVMLVSDHLERRV